MKSFFFVILSFVLFTFILFSCGSEIQEEVKLEEEVVPDEGENNEETPEESNGTPNILFVITDDMGLDATPGYAIGNTKPNMPNLQNLIDNGIRFNNLWSSPTCSPTRATILTGKYSHRNGVVKVTDYLSTTHTSLQSYIASETNNIYSSAVFGKWHLSNSASHPNDMGVSHFAGSSGGGLPSYTGWTLNINGQTQFSSEYATTKITDLAIDWIEDQTKPWFAWVAYNAPHTPFHLPPTTLHSQGTLPTDQASIDANPLPYYMAMIEAVDTEYGRLTASLTEDTIENTIIIFIGDNGTPNQVLQEYAFRHGKGSTYEGGINVPMIISGNGVTRINDSEDALIGTSDLYATIASIAGVNVSTIHDSYNFKDLLTSTTNANQREYAFVLDGNDDGTINYTIRNTSHKYVQLANGNEQFFDLLDDPLENTNLLGNNQPALNSTESSIKSDLISEMNSLLN